MPELPEAAQRLLSALVDIEERATTIARANGCECDAPIPDNPGRTFPYASFNYQENIGKPFNQIVWEMRHQDGCPMDGQKGVGLTTYGYSA
jgi:hypothetical protein